MRQSVRLKVCIHTDQGRVVCMCLKAHKRCKKDCATDTVTWDRYDGWQGTMKRGRFGK